MDNNPVDKFAAHLEQKLHDDIIEDALAEGDIYMEWRNPDHSINIMGLFLKTCPDSVVGREFLEGILRLQPIKSKQAATIAICAAVSLDSVVDVVVSEFENIKSR